MFYFYDSNEKILKEILLKNYNKDEDLDNIYEAINNIHVKFDNESEDCINIINNKKFKIESNKKKIIIRIYLKIRIKK